MTNGAACPPLATGDARDQIEKLLRQGDKALATAPKVAKMPSDPERKLLVGRCPARPSGLDFYQLVLLYKHRWDIEEIFHQFKSKTGERKSWVRSLEAKQSHGIFECLSHNLLLLFEHYLDHGQGLRDPRTAPATQKFSRGRLGNSQNLYNFMPNPDTRFTSTFDPTRRSPPTATPDPTLPDARNRLSRLNIATPAISHPKN